MLKETFRWWLWCAVKLAALTVLFTVILLIIVILFGNGPNYPYEDPFQF